jgi:cell division protein FtsW
MREKDKRTRPARPLQVSAESKRRRSEPPPALSSARRRASERQPPRRPDRQPARQPARVVDLQERRARRDKAVTRGTNREPVQAKGERTPRPRLNPLSFSLIGLVSVMSLFGLVMIYSSSSNLAYLQYGNGFYFLERQAMAAAIGLLFMIGLARRDYHQLVRYSPLLLVIGLAMLVMCFIPSLSYMTNGSRRFLRFGIQPSEFVKLALILFVGMSLARRDRNVRDLFDLAFPTLAVTGLVLLLVILEPDMGTTIIIGCTVLVMLIVAEARWVHLVSITFLGSICSVALIFSSSYRFHRFFAFLNPWDDPQGGGFHIIQSMLAMGSGNIYGMGLGMSRQKFMYLPNAHNDFIFSIIGEEMGFIGTLFVVALFVTFILIGVKIARRAPDGLGRQIAMGITFLIGAQAFVNMGAVTGILPITGVTLPFISYGGSSLVIFMALIGILINIATREKVAQKQVTDERETDAHSDLWGRYRGASVSSTRSRR